MMKRHKIPAERQLFTTESYCIQNITETINNLGGNEEGKLVPRQIDLNADRAYQKGLFDYF